MAYMPLVTCIVSFIFAVTVLDQYFARRKPYQIVWAIGLFMYAISTFTEFWWNVYGHAEIIYRLWYLVGAVLVAAYLGQGTLYLVMRRKIAHIIMTPANSKIKNKLRLPPTLMSEPPTAGRIAPTAMRILARTR